VSEVCYPGFDSEQAAERGLRFSWADRVRSPLAGVEVAHSLSSKFSQAASASVFLLGNLLINGMAMDCFDSYKFSRQFLPSFLNIFICERHSQTVQVIYVSLLPRSMTTR